MKHDGKWAQQLIGLQKPDGSWGDFHTLSARHAGHVTTEQALRRLEILGYTAEDEPVALAVSYLVDCLEGRKRIPDRAEKVQDWEVFVSLMLSAWIRRFTHECPEAERTAQLWSGIISAAFESGNYDQSAANAAYKRAFGCSPKGGRLADFVSFYQVSLVADLLDEAAASAFVDHVLHHKAGIYYVYDKPLAILPECFASRQTVRYLNGIELLAGYRSSASKLSFVREWLEENCATDGTWDLGTAAKDGISFPLSDSWRSSENRISDCTERIRRLLNHMNFQRPEE